MPMLKISQNESKYFENVMVFIKRQYKHLEKNS